MIQDFEQNHVLIYHGAPTMSKITVSYGFQGKTSCFRFLFPDCQICLPVHPLSLWKQLAQDPLAEFHLGVIPALS